jgi:hypothetical protein
VLTYKTLESLLYKTALSGHYKFLEELGSLLKHLASAIFKANALMLIAN